MEFQPCTQIQPNDGFGSLADIRHTTPKSPLIAKTGSHSLSVLCPLLEERADLERWQR